MGEGREAWTAESEGGSRLVSMSNEKKSSLESRGLCDVFPSFSFAIAVANRSVNLTEGIPYIR